MPDPPSGWTQFVDGTPQFLHPSVDSTEGLDLWYSLQPCCGIRAARSRLVSSIPKMFSEQDRTQKLFNSLLRVPKKISRTASPRVVHQLRTTIRRVEALLAALGADAKVEAKLLKQLARLRRRAGKVRDLDVQIAALRGVRLESTAKDKERVMRALHKAHAKR